jgi:2,3-bisphosphoglycerate-dependent phosphoglycerate mutase
MMYSLPPFTDWNNGAGLKVFSIKLLLVLWVIGNSSSILLSPKGPTNTVPFHTRTTSAATTINAKSLVPMHSTRPQSGYDTSAEYERFLSSKKKKKMQKLLRWRKRRKNKEEDEDGYAAMMKRSQPWWKSTVISPLVRRTANFLLSPTSSSRINKQVGKLILIRHGESEWNKNKTFTGWADPDLSQQGYREVEYAARLLLEGGYTIDVVFTSRLQRAIRSTWILLGEINQLFLPVFKSWRLNERNYGALTGLCKMETAQKLGVQLVQSWRGSLKSRPPPLDPLTSIYWPGNDRRYSDLLPSQIPQTESLLDCMERTKPLWQDKISYELRMGRNVLVVAHANTLRGLVKLIDNIGDEDIQQVSIPTGIPIVYKFHKTSSNAPLQPIPPADTALSQMHMSGIFLEKPGMLKEALKREKEWIDNVPGYSESMSRSKTPMTPLERSLSKLAAEKELKKWAGQFVDYQKLLQEDDGSDGGHMGNPLQSNIIVDKLLQNENEDTVTATSTAASPNMITRNDLCVVSPPLGTTAIIPDDASSSSSSTSAATSIPTTSAPIRRDPTIVLIRHGKTEHNKLGLFTGWQVSYFLFLFQRLQDISLYFFSVFFLRINHLFFPL